MKDDFNKVHMYNYRNVYSMENSNVDINTYSWKHFIDWSCNQLNTT